MLVIIINILNNTPAISSHQEHMYIADICDNIKRADLWSFE